METAGADRLPWGDPAHPVEAGSGRGPLPAGRDDQFGGGEPASQRPQGFEVEMVGMGVADDNDRYIMRSSPGGGPTMRLSRRPYLMSGLSEKTGSVTSAFRPRRTRNDEWPSQKMPSPAATGTTRGRASAVLGAPAAVPVSCVSCQASRCGFPEWKQASSTPQSATTPSARRQPRRPAGATAFRGPTVRTSSPAFLKRTAIGIGITSCQTRDRAGAAHRSRLP